MKKWIKIHIAAWLCLVAILPVLIVEGIMGAEAEMALLTLLSLIIVWIVLLVKSFKLRNQEPDMQEKNLKEVNKKRIMIIAIVLLSYYSVYATIGSNVVQKKHNELFAEFENYKAKYNELQENYDRLITAASISRPEILPDAETNEPVPEVKEEKPVVALGSSRSNPIVVTASQFANEINSNTDAAKTKYNGKWVQITGKVLSANNVAGMTNFYLYGERGGSGLRIVCWVNKEVFKPFDYRGETHTFVGQVREVTTVNATEIGDCEIIE